MGGRQEQKNRTNEEVEEHIRQAKEPELELRDVELYLAAVRITLITDEEGGKRAMTRRGKEEGRDKQKAL